MMHISIEDFLHNDARVETNVIIALRSISPSNMMVQLLDPEPPGEQPYKNKANASTGGKLKSLMNAYES